MKRFFALFLALILALSLFGCVNAPAEEGSPTPETTETQTPAETTEPALTVTVVIAGGLGDRSFYDSAAAGLERLKTEYGVITKVIECKEEPSMFKTQLINAAEISDVVIAVGWQMHDPLVEVAPEMPNVKFIYVDESIDGIENVYNIKYAQNEGSFLVGYIAAKMSETGKIGAVGGSEDDVIKDFIVGYEQGAKYAKNDIDVKVVYANDFEDPARGKECALSLYNQGCDIVFQIAGKTGEGVFEAAQEKGKYAIGVDADQKYINDKVIICSMKKEVGNSIFDAVKSLIELGEFKGGEVWIADMASGFIDVGYGDEGMEQQVSDELKAEVEELKGKIISNEITVETTRS